MANIYHLIHPGEILLDEFLEPMGISQYRLAKDISVPPRRINETEKDKLQSRLEREVHVYVAA